VGDARKAFLLRLPPDLHRDLEQWAADELRSLNAQIEYILRQEVRKRKRSARDRSNDQG